MKRAPEAPPAARSLALSLGLHGALVGLGLLPPALLGLGRTFPLPPMEIQLISRPRERASPGRDTRSDMARPAPQMTPYRRRSADEPRQRSAAWYQKAAEQGDARAQIALAGLHYMGYGVAKDAGKAVAWYRKAAEQGEAQAQANLGTMYYQGSGVPQDYKEAAAWYRKAALQGDPPSQYILGAMHAQGNGVPADPEEAVVWYRSAAAQGYPDAQYQLGYAYESGFGVSAPDRAEALRWYRRAADQDFTPPQRESRLGDLWHAACTSRPKRKKKC